MPDRGARPLRGFGLRSERLSWILLAVSLVLWVALLWMAWSDGGPIWFTAASFVIFPACALYCGIWYRRRRRGTPRDDAGR